MGRPGCTVSHDDREEHRKPVVEDRAANRVVLDAVLGTDHNLIFAASGAEALARVRSRSDIDLILMDVQMPEMDGFETAARIKQLPEGRDIPIVFVSAVHTDDPFVRRGYEVGGLDYVSKPFDPERSKLKVSVYATLATAGAKRALQLRESDEFARIAAASRRRSRKAVRVLISKAMRPDAPCRCAMRWRGWPAGSRAGARAARPGARSPARRRRVAMSRARARSSLRAGERERRAQADLVLDVRLARAAEGEPRRRSGDDSRSERAYSRSRPTWNGASRGRPRPYSTDGGSPSRSPLAIASSTAASSSSSRRAQPIAVLATWLLCDRATTGRWAPSSSARWSGRRRWST